MENTHFPRTHEHADTIDLSFIPDKWCGDMLRDAMHAVVSAQDSQEISSKEIDVWNYLSSYEPPSGEGFMFSRGDPVISRIQASMQIGHSGSTMALTMRNLQLLARIGLSKYREGYIL